MRPAHSLNGLLSNKLTGTSPVSSLKVSLLPAKRQKMPLQKVGRYVEELKSYRCSLKSWQDLLKSRRDLIKSRQDYIFFRSFAYIPKVRRDLFRHCKVLAKPMVHQSKEKQTEKRWPDKCKRIRLLKDTD